MARQLDALSKTPGSILSLSWVGGFRQTTASTYARHSLQDASVLPAAVDRGPTGTVVPDCGGEAIEGDHRGA